MFGARCSALFFLSLARCVSHRFHAPFVVGSISVLFNSFAPTHSHPFDSHSITIFPHIYLLLSSLVLTHICFATSDWYFFFLFGPNCHDHSFCSRHIFFGLSKQISHINSSNYLLCKSFQHIIFHHTLLLLRCAMCVCLRVCKVLLLVFTECLRRRCLLYMRRSFVDTLMCYNEMFWN